MSLPRSVRNWWWTSFGLFAATVSSAFLITITPSPSPSPSSTSTTNRQPRISQAGYTHILQHSHPSLRQQSWQNHVRKSFHPGNVQCSSSSRNPLALAMSDRTPTVDDATLLAAHNDAINYTPISMQLPDRVQSDSHAIFGTLLKEHCIERYQCYGVVGKESVADSTDPVVVAIVQLGTKLDGHLGVVHGGILALLVDDVLGFSYEALEHDERYQDIRVPMAVTANLNVNYRQPVPVNSTLCIETYLTEHVGRKLVWTAKVVNAHDPSQVFCEVSSVYVIPRRIFEEMESKS